ncbi:hypothetical protein [Pseudoalteromonas sp. MMG024]|uniref:hypothetical protein n=1 Tax=Pseudoalteromonas sp. MMG024 TaxID=2909980 RepID=UPI001F3DAC90|nr:hypothetical protein [Pseudoalteromonas sp. MMG024]MCF6456757.1 hypothetical protein [Pseudoalteromonas sp. MMG024]
MIPTLGLWPATGLSQIALEVCALITAFVYFKAYQRLEKRAYFGEKESIWSLDKSKQLNVEGTASISK